MAMAAMLVELGYAPVIMFNSEFNETHHAMQDVAAMLYHAQEISNAKLWGKIGASSPPVFVMDAHREDWSGTGGNPRHFKNSYSYKERDLPSADELKKQGIKRVVYLNEGDQDGEIRPEFQGIRRVWRDLKGVVSKWETAGIKMLYTGVEPWEHTDSELELSELGRDL